MSIQEVLMGESFFWYCTVVGSLLFLIQFFITLIGLGEFEELAGESPEDLSSFKWISRQGITGFLMMFGLSALTLQHEFDIHGYLKLVISLGIGFFTMYVITKLLIMSKKLHCPGTVFKIDNVIGLEGSVYQRIPAHGIGKITLCVDNFTREIDALSLERIDIPSFTQVIIVKKFDDKTVLVQISVI